MQEGQLLSAMEEVQWCASHLHFLPPTHACLQPQQFYGETGAQSAILHALDAALGIRHDQCRCGRCPASCCCCCHCVLSRRCCCHAGPKSLTVWYSPAASMLHPALTSHPPRCPARTRSWLAAYLRDMRQHMPPAHRAFVAHLEAGTSLRSAVEGAPGNRALRVRASGRRVACAVLGAMLGAC